MQNKNKSLKSQNWKYLLPGLGFHLFAFHVVSTGVQNAWGSFEKIMNSTVWSAAIGISGLVFNGIISGDIKASLVFMRIKEPLPGSRAFSKYMHNNPRIDASVLTAKFGEFPVDPKKQNLLWYKIYRKHRNDIAVLDAHQNYLAVRDLTYFTTVFLCVGAPMMWALTNSMERAGLYGLGLLGLYFVLSHSARVYGIRLVTNVLAAESS